MSKTQDVSVLFRIYQNQILRFGVFPDNREDFEEKYYFENLKYELVKSRVSAHGTLVCQKGDVRLIYDPVTGIFKLNLKKKEILKGNLQTGQFGEALFYLAIKEEELLSGLGGLQVINKSKNLELTYSDYDLNYNVESKNIPHSNFAFPFYLIASENRYIGIFWNNVLPICISYICRQTTSKDLGIYIYPHSGQKLPITQDFFIFLGTVPEIYKQFFSLFGQSILPPIWSFGLHYSNFYLNTNEKIETQCKRFEKENLPIDTIYLNQNFLENNIKINQNITSYKEKYDNNKKEESNENEVKKIIDLPLSVNADDELELFNEGIEKDYFCKNNQGFTYYFNIFKKKYVIPDLTKAEVVKWWRGFYSIILKNKINGFTLIKNPINNKINKLNNIKNKRNINNLEDKIIHIKGSHYYLSDYTSTLLAQITHNSFLDNKVNSKPFVLNFNGSVGTHKYTITSLGGDDELKLNWHSLNSCFHKLLNLSLSGVPICGTDFNTKNNFPNFNIFNIPFSNNGEVFVRCIEYLTLLPFFRIKNNSKFQNSIIENFLINSFAFGKLSLKNIDLIKKHFLKRLTLLPYFYTLAKQCFEEKNLFIRPLYYDFPNINYKLVSEQMMIGPNLLSAPILTPNAKSKKVFLPEGVWYEYESGTLYQGNTIHHFSTPLGYSPLFVKAGTILPSCYPKNNAISSYDEKLILEVYPSVSQELSGNVFIDDGVSTLDENACLNISITGKMNTSNVLSLDVKGIKKIASNPFKSLVFYLPVKYIYLQLEDKKIEGVIKEIENRNYTVCSFELPFENGKYTFRTN